MRCATNERAAYRAHVATLCLLSLLCARTAQAEVVRLAQLEERALRSRPSLQVASARVAEANARVDMTTAAVYPTLMAAASIEALPGSWLVNVEDIDGERFVVQGSRTLGQSGAFTPQTRYSASLIFNARVYDFGRTHFSIGAAKATRAAAQQRARAGRFLVLDEVRATYLGWLSAHQSQRILRQNAREAEQLRQNLEGRIEEGTRPGAELATARYDEAQAKLAVEQSEADLAVARDRLEQATGSRLPAAAEPDLTLLDQLPTHDESGALANLDALRLERSAAHSNAQAQRRSRAPLLSANMEGGLHGQSSQLFPQYRVGLSLSMLLLDGGLSNASAALADAQASALSAQAREARDQLESERSRTGADVERAQRRLTTAQGMLAAAREQLTHARDQLELGTAPPDLVIKARQRVAQAELEVLGARVARAQARLRIGM
jgi:outer membrane protein, multidrug efflux system